MLANGAFVRLVVAGICCSDRIYVKKKKKFKHSSNLQLYVCKNIVESFCDITGYRT